MKATFTTYKGTPYFYDSISGKVGIDQEDAHVKWKKSQIFSKMRTPTEDHVLENINHRQHSVTLNITEDCSNRCLYCIYSGHYDHERTHTHIIMDPNVAKKAVKHFLSHSTKTHEPTIGFFGGEPLMEGAFDVVRDVVDYAHSISDNKNLSFSITSNGRHITSDVLRFLVDNNVYLSISLDGPAEVHDRYRRSREGTPTYNEIMENLQKIMEYNPSYYRKVGFVCVLTPPLDYQIIRDFFNTHDLVKGHNLTISIMQLIDNHLPFTFNKEQFIIDYSSMYRDCIQSFYDAVVNYKIAEYPFEYALLGTQLALIHQMQVNSNDTEDYTIELNGCCVPGARKCFIDTDGTIYTCEQIGHCIPLGDVFKYINPQTVIDMIQEYHRLSEAACLKCWCAKFCDLCFVSARDGTTLNYKCKSVACQERKNFSKALLRLYASLSEVLDTNQLSSLLPQLVD